MTKKELEFTLQYNKYLKGGIKESCIKVQDYLKQIQFIESNSSINFEEFIECINILMGFSFQAKDIIPEKYFCNCDCRHSGCLLCPGEFSISKNAKKLCPFYKQEDK